MTGALAVVVVMLGVLLLVASAAARGRRREAVDGEALESMLPSRGWVRAPELGPWLLELDTHLSCLVGGTSRRVVGTADVVQGADLQGRYWLHTVADERHHHTCGIGELDRSLPRLVLVQRRKVADGTHLGAWGLTVLDVPVPPGWVVYGEDPAYAVRVLTPGACAWLAGEARRVPDPSGHRSAEFDVEYEVGPGFVACTTGPLRAANLPALADRVRTFRHLALAGADW